MLKTVISLISQTSGKQLTYKGVTTYSAKVRQMMASIAGLRMNTEIHEKRKAKRPPKASKMYEYSAPDLVIKVPSSA